MAIKTILDSTLSAIADAIRAKTGTTETITPLQMPSAIASIPTGGGGSSSSEGLYDCLAELGYDADTIAELNALRDEDIAYSKTITTYSAITGNTKIRYINEDVDFSGVRIGMGLFRNCRSLITIPAINFSNCTHFQQFFDSCNALQYIPWIDVSKATTIMGMFINCSALKTIPLIQFPLVTSLQNVFSGCSSLQNIPLLDTSNITAMIGMLNGCSSLTTIPQLDTSEVTNMQSMFQNCSSLTTIPLLDTTSVTNTGYMFSGCTNLENLGGFTGLKVGIDLSASNKLTHDSLMNVINNLATITTTQTLKLGSTNLAKLTNEEKAIATNKGWTLA